MTPWLWTPYAYIFFIPYCTSWAYFLWVLKTKISVYLTQNDPLPVTKMEILRTLVKYVPTASAFLGHVETSVLVSQFAVYDNEVHYLGEAHGEVSAGGAVSTDH